MTLTIDGYARDLEQFAQTKFIGKYISEKSKHTLIEKAQSLSDIIKRKKGKNQPVEWKFEIPIDEPIKFIKSCSDSLNFELDVSCEIEGKNLTITKQNILLRLWSLDKKICFRNGIDDPELENAIEKNGHRRVILRFHFDKKDPKTTIPEPQFHMQVGGIHESYENCWIPKEIKIPRLPFLPLDFILLCEIILVNFFPMESEDLRKKPEWKSLIKKSQEMFLRQYIENCSGYLNNAESTFLEKIIYEV